jgi:hypothetical protein
MLCLPRLSDVHTRGSELRAYLFRMGVSKRRHAKYVELKKKWETVEPQLEQLSKLQAENKLLHEAVQILKSQQATAASATATAAAPAPAPAPAVAEASAASFGFGDSSGSWAAFGEQSQSSSAAPVATASAAEVAPAPAGEASATQPTSQLSAKAQTGKALFTYAAADETEVPHLHQHGFLLCFHEVVCPDVMRRAYAGCR